MSDDRTVAFSTMSEMASTAPEESTPAASAAPEGGAAEYAPDGPLARQAAAVIPYYPFKGIDRFYDIGGLLRNPALFDAVCEAMAARYRAAGVTAIGGIDARGFLFVPVAMKVTQSEGGRRKGWK